MECARRSQKTVCDCHTEECVRYPGQGGQNGERSEGIKTFLRQFLRKLTPYFTRAEAEANELTLQICLLTTSCQLLIVDLSRPAVEDPGVPCLLSDYVTKTESETDSETKIPKRVSQRERQNRASSWRGHSSEALLCPLINDPNQMRGKTESRAIFDPHPKVAKNLPKYCFYALALLNMHHAQLAMDLAVAVVFGFPVACCLLPVACPSPLITVGDVTKKAAVTHAVTAFPLVLNHIRSVTAFTDFSTWWL